jgi:hypothetical protein
MNSHDIKGCSAPCECQICRFLLGAAMDHSRRKPTVKSIPFPVQEGFCEQRQRRSALCIALPADPKLSNHIQLP